MKRALFNFILFMSSICFAQDDYVRVKILVKDAESGKSIHNVILDDLNSNRGALSDSSDFRFVRLSNQEDMIGLEVKMIGYHRAKMLFDELIPDQEIIVYLNPIRINEEERHRRRKWF